MTVSPDTHPDQGKPRHEERDFSQRAEQEGSESKTLRLFLIIALIAIGTIGIPVAVVLFSAGVQDIAGEDVEPSEGPGQEHNERLNAPE